MKISDIGEKRLIAEFIKPLFNATNDAWSVGDDCAVVDLGHEQVIIASTDRVPADLIAFRAGILDYFGLGSYLVRLNLSDIAASGGSPVGLLLNCGLPPHLEFADFQKFCQGVQETAVRFGCKVLGGDMTDSETLSLSATSMGYCDKKQLLLRRTARPNDWIFCSRPIGIAPLAIAYYRRPVAERPRLSPDAICLLQHHLTSLDPMLELGRRLSTSGTCTSCMDNTDGISQTLNELADASGLSFAIQASQLPIPVIVKELASAFGAPIIELALGPGADFSLVGTLDGQLEQTEITRMLGEHITVLGRTESGNGVTLHQHDGTSEPLPPQGWAYF